MAVPNFTTSTIGLNKLVLTDTSDYETTVITSRYWILTKSTGETTIEPHPIADGVSKEIEIDKDYALIVRLALNYNPTNGTSQYSKVKNVLVAPTLADTIYDLRKKLLDDNLNCIEDKKLLDDIEFIDSFSDAAIYLISTDIIAAQKALDRGNDIANKYKCEV